MRIRRIAFLALAAMLAACEGSTVPDGVEGVYNLSTVDGRGLPVWANPTGVQGTGRELRGGTLRLRAPDQVELVLRSRLYDVDGAAPQNVADTLHGTYTMQGTVPVLDVQAKGFYWLEPVVRVVSGRRLDGVLHVVAPAYTGYTALLVDASFTR
jgi:hypothetical protein